MKSSMKEIKTQSDDYQARFHVTFERQITNT